MTAASSKRPANLSSERKYGTAMRHTVAGLKRILFTDRGLRGNSCANEVLVWPVQEVDFLYGFAAVSGILQNRMRTSVSRTRLKVEQGRYGFACRDMQVN